MLHAQIADLNSNKSDIFRDIGNMEVERCQNNRVSSLEVGSDDSWSVGADVSPDGHGHCLGY
jgi:hypothetical protein